MVDSVRKRHIIGAFVVRCESNIIALPEFICIGLGSTDSEDYNEGSSSFMFSVISYISSRILSFVAPGSQYRRECDQAE